MKYFKHDDGIRVYEVEDDVVPWDGVSEISKLDLVALRGQWNKDNDHKMGLSNPYGEEPISEDISKGGIFDRVDGKLVRKAS